MSITGERTVRRKEKFARPVVAFNFFSTLSTHTGSKDPETHNFEKANYFVLRHVSRAKKIVVIKIYFKTIEEFTCVIIYT